MTHPRLIDATATECLLSARHALESATLQELPGLLEIPVARRAAPFLPEGSYGAGDLGVCLEAADVMEPLTWAAHRALQVIGPRRSGQVLVDPVGTLLGADPSVAARPGASAVDEAGKADATDEAGPHAGWVYEHVRWLPPRHQDAAPEVLVADIADALAMLPPDDRLRLRDPDGALDLVAAERLAEMSGAQRLTVVPEDARGFAVAIAAILLRAPSGPAVRSSLLGIGPRTGLAGTELLLPAVDAMALQALAERAALVAGEAIAPTHPLWGARAREAPEPERIGPHLDVPARWNPATLPLLLDRHLEAWGSDPDPPARAHLLRLLAARLRPGEALDGPLLYAFVATHLDLDKGTLKVAPQGDRVGRT